MRTVGRCIRGCLAAVAAIAVMGAVVFGATLPASASASAASTAQAGAGLPIVPVRGALFGAAVNAQAGQDVRSAVTGLESDLGRKLDVHRLYDNWDSPQPNSIAAWDATAGRTPVLSINAQRGDGSVVRWADIAAGRQDAAIRAQAAGLQSLNVPIFLSLHHEPENDPGNGTPADYVAAWRHYVSVFRSMGVSNVAFTWILMAWSFVTPAKADSYYPGDDVVDYVGADGYNWYGTSPDKQWRSLADALGPFYAWGSAHHKPLMLAEWGSLEDPAVPGRKAAWLTDAAAALQTMPAIKVVCYFHAPVTFPWWVDSSASSLQAFAAMGNDPYFRTVPEAALSLTPASGPAPLGTMISGAGSYTADEGGLSWRLDFGDGSAPLVSSTPPGNVTHVYSAGSYTVRLSVSDLAGTRDVSTGTVTALPAPTVSTNRASDVAAGAATLNGHVDPNGLDTSAWFQYGPTTGYGSATPATPAGADTRPVPVAATVSLAPNTAYHYRALASNGAGTSVGADSTFTTPGPPAATTGGASGLTATAATLGGMVDANGLDATSWFEYGTSTGYGSRTAAGDAGDAGYNVSVNATVGGLAPSTSYHYRAVARNSSGLAYGADRTFTTAGPATVTTGGASGLTATAATLGGSVDPNGLATTYRAEWGPTTGYGWTSTWRSAGSATWGATVSVAVTGLASRQLYHYRLVATNSSGTTYGSDRTLTTSR